MHDGELVWHRYEAPGVITPAKGLYRYFVTNDVGGMLLSSTGKSKTSLKSRKVFADYHLSVDNLRMMNSSIKEVDEPARYEAVKCSVTQSINTAIYIERR